MKNLFIFFAGVFVFTTACQRGNIGIEPLSEKKYPSFEALFDDLASRKNTFDQEKVIEMEVVWDKSSGEVAINTWDEKEPGFFVIDNVAGGDGDFGNIECCCKSNGDIRWSKLCDNKFSCGTLINDCLEAGGCATICSATIVFVPATNFVYIQNTMSSGI